MHYFFLSVAVVAEVVGMAALKSSGGFSKTLPSLITVASFVLSLVCFALALRGIPMGVAYAVWSGLGIILVAGVGWFAHQQSLDPPAIAGLGLILAGCITINLFSTAPA
jgi:small multidrug resistance pump